MANEPKPQPPYVSYGIFRSTVDALAKSTVPNGALDRRVLDHLSGADYGALIPALRFLRFIDADKKATEDFKTLVKSSAQDTVAAASDYKIWLLAALTNAYEPILGKFDLEHGTPSEFEKAFRDYGVAPGQMMTKTVRFCIKAYTEAGVKVSPHILKAKPKTPKTLGGKNGAEKTRRGGDDPAPPLPPAINDPIPAGYERMPIPGMVNTFIQYPAHLTEGDCSLMEAMIVALKAYAKVRSGVEAKP